jgi:prefoldin alpha subunit
MDQSERKAQETYYEFQALEQHMKQLQSNLEMITQQLMEAAITKRSLDEFKEIKPGKEAFVPLSTGIFAKAAISETSEVLVNVGANIVVVKDIESAKALVQNQVEEMKKVQSHLISELEKLSERASSLEEQMQKMAPQ